MKGGGDKMQYTLKELRARKGLSQSVVAKEMGVSVQTYGAWEADFGIVKIQNAVKLAHFFGVKVDEIFFDFRLENNSSKNKETEI